MRLVSFHVKVFRNVIDSGPIKVGGTTCLVGKNESGKSALLEALHRLNPAKPTPLNLLDEYPRWLKKEHEISGEIKEAVPISATFELSPAELKELEKRFGVGVLGSGEVEVYRQYAGDPKVKVMLDHARFIATFKERAVPGIIQSRITSEDATDLLKELEVMAEETGSNNEPTPEAQAAKLALAKLTEILGNAGSLTEAVTALVTPLIPRTFYFSTYSQLRGRYNLKEVLPALKKGSEDEEIQAAADFLRLARVTPTNVETWDFEASNAELEAISSLLTQRVRANWKQNAHLRLVVKIESVQGQNNQIDRFLQFRVEDTRHDFTSRLDRRSTGFQWFVSFIASFFEFEKDQNLILLLDEPGLSLHARAQLDLLDAIDKNLTQGRQVLYSTHSPFMVRTEVLDRVRIVEDQGPERGSIVANDAGVTTDPDTLFPLQAALGYDVSQTLFIGNRNVLLEGVSDLIYLSVISSYLGAQQRATLPVNVRLLPCGGATNIATFIALLGKQLPVVVLLDGNSARQRIDNAITEGRLSANRVLSLNKFCGVAGADIEDLFEPAEYSNLYNATFGKTLSLAALTGTDRIVKRIERADGVEFDHGRVAGHFVANQGAILPALSQATLGRFEAVISALTQALPPIP